MLISFHMEVSLFTDDEAYIDGRKMAGSFKLSQMYSENNTGWESGPDYRRGRLAWMLSAFLCNAADTCRRALVDRTFKK